MDTSKKIIADRKYAGINKYVGRCIKESLLEDRLARHDVPICWSGDPCMRASRVMVRVLLVVGPGVQWDGMLTQFIAEEL